MPLEMDRFIVGFSHRRLGLWIKEMQTNKLTISTPIELYVSYRISGDVNLARCNAINLLREIIATMIYSRMISNTQQVYEVGFEKKRGERDEVSIIVLGACRDN